jgi:hypothetical protein
VSPFVGEFEAPPFEEFVCAQLFLLMCNGRWSSFPRVADGA